VAGISFTSRYLDREDMVILKSVEVEVGGPTYILIPMFVETPINVTLKKVSALLYGNGVKKETAAEF
jgi:hypothetical protein